jgi:ATP-dependent protease ClpP protease subunit
LLNPLQSTKILALSVVHGYHRKEKAARRLLAHERDWISNGTIPESKQGRHAKVLCMLEDPGTREAMRVYINSTGRTVNAAGLAGAITGYWTEIRKVFRRA